MDVLTALILRSSTSLASSICPTFSPEKGFFALWRSRRLKPLFSCSTGLCTCCIRVDMKLGLFRSAAARERSDFLCAQ